MARAAFGDFALAFFRAGAAFGDFVLAVFVAGAAFGDSALAVFASVTAWGATKRCERLFKGVSTLINVFNVDVTANFKLYLGERLRAIMHLCTYSPLNRRLQCFVFRGKVPTFRKTFNVFNASVFSHPFPSAAFAVLVFRFFCFLDVLFWADFWRQKVLQLCKGIGQTNRSTPRKVAQPLLSQLQL